MHIHTYVSVNKAFLEKNLKIPKINSKQHIFKNDKTNHTKQMPQRTEHTILSSVNLGEYILS